LEKHTSKSKVYLKGKRGAVRPLKKQVDLAREIRAIRNLTIFKSLQGGGKNNQQPRRSDRTERADINEATTIFAGARKGPGIL